MRIDNECTVCCYHKICSRTILAIVYVLEVYAYSLIVGLDIRHGFSMLVDTFTTFDYLGVRSLTAISGQLSVNSSAETIILSVPAGILEIKVPCALDRPITL